MRVLAVAALTIVSPRVATASCVEEARLLREHLTDESHGVRMWNTLWAIGFGAAAIGQATLLATETKPFGDFDTDFKEQTYVGTAKATLAVAARVVLPLRIKVPAADTDPCVDVIALRGAVIDAGRRERRTIWLTLIGGTVINLTGSIILWSRRNFETGAISFLTGVPFGPLSAITQPRGSSKLARERAVTWSVGVGGVGGDPRSLWIAGEF